MYIVYKVYLNLYQTGTYIYIYNVGLLHNVYFTPHTHVYIHVCIYMYMYIHCPADNGNYMYMLANFKCHDVQNYTM